MVKFDELPVEIQEKMLDEQENQGNPRNPDIFRKSISCGRAHGGFNWDESDAGHTTWDQSLHYKTSNHDLFFQKYPKQNPKKEFTLPKNWHVVVTEENQKEVNAWIQDQVLIGDVAGIADDGISRPSFSGYNPGVIRHPEGHWDFGTEITTEQFRKYVLKKEAEVIYHDYPKVMEVSNYEDFSIRRKRVVFMEKKGEFIAWSKAQTIEEAENELETANWKYARDPQVVYLTLQDISEGKGVGVDPELIRIKE